MAEYRVESAPDTVHWGYFDAHIPPVLTVASGDTVTISTRSGPPETLPPAGFGTVAPDHLAIHAAHQPRFPGHICTGPVAVAGIMPGETLEVRIREIALNDDWGFTFSAPLKGALPDDFETSHLFHSALDAERMMARLPWGLDLPLRPFFGVMAVAPPAAWGPVNTLPPRRNAGNLDNKELVAGTILYLPVHVEGALFSVGDGHGAQGDGEVCVTAIETGLVGTFELHRRPDLRLTWPMAETPTHVMTMAFDPDLDTCVTVALRTMLDLVVERTGLARQEAYALCSLAADLRITQVVNGAKGVHVMLEKANLVGYDG